MSQGGVAWLLGGVCDATRLCRDHGRRLFGVAASTLGGRRAGAQGGCEVGAINCILYCRAYPRQNPDGTVDYPDDGTSNTDSLFDHYILVAQYETGVARAARWYVLL